MFEIGAYHIALAGFGGAIILAHWLPRFIGLARPTASAFLVVSGAVVIGTLPGMPQIFDPVGQSQIWTVASEMVVIIALFGTGLRIDGATHFHKWKPALRLVLVAMPLTIAAIVFAGSWLGLTLAGAVLLGAVLAPTDPVLAADLQVSPPREGGEPPARFALTAEAGLNDALAFPFVYAAILLASGSFGWTEFLSFYVLYKIAVGFVCGAALGWVLGKILFVIPRSSPLADTNAGGVAIAGIIATYGLTELVEGYGFLAVFIMALWLRHEESDHEFHASLHEFSEVIEHTLTAILLVSLGVAIPLLWQYLDCRAALAIAAFIFVIRPIAGWISLTRMRFSSRERATVAFYGVRGIGSIFYLAYAIGKADFADANRLWAIVAFTILASTIIHGLSTGYIVKRISKANG